MQAVQRCRRCSVAGGVALQAVREYPRHHKVGITKNAKLTSFPILGLMAIFQFLFLKYITRLHQYTGICVDNTDLCVLSPFFCVLYTDFCVKGTIFRMKCTGYCVMCTGFCVKSHESFHIIINLGKKKMEFLKNDFTF